MPAIWGYLYGICMYPPNNNTNQRGSLYYNQRTNGEIFMDNYVNADQNSTLGKIRMGGMQISADRVSSIYGASSTVTPPSRKTNFLIRY